jgi:type I restriction enzyme M protein
VLASLKSTGKGAIILPHGVLFRGGAEADIRRSLIQRGFIKGIIGLPANLFYGTGIPACILVLDKEHAVARKGIFMIDASKGFMKDGNKNRLRERDIHRIVDAYTRQLELPRYSRLVPVAEVEQNGFNLNLPRYIDTTDPEDLQDLEGHLRGGIPERDVEALGAWWSVLPGLREVLAEALRPSYLRLRVEPKSVKTTIFGHPAFAEFQARVRTHFAAWKAENKATLENIGPGQRPRLLIESLSAPLLAAFAPLPLIDPYAIYQHLMDYWAEQLQDDAWMLIQAGWKAKDEAGKPNRELIPPELIIRRYFAKEQAALEALETTRDAHTLALQELEEEHGGEEGLLFEAKNEKGKLTRASVKARLAVVGEAEPAAPTEGTQVVLTWDGADVYHHRLLDFFVSNQHQGASPSVGELLEREYFSDWSRGVSDLRRCPARRGQPDLHHRPRQVGSRELERADLGPGRSFCGLALASPGGLRRASPSGG